MSHYEIQGENNHIEVYGTLKDDGEVKVRYNDDEYVFNSGSGDFSTGAASAELICSDGSYIKEGAVTQDIKLPNGTMIEKGAASKKATLPNGTTIQPEPSGNYTEISISGTNIKIESSHSTNSGENIKVSSKEDENVSIMKTNEYVSKMTPGFFTTLFIVYGLMFNLDILLLGLMIYSLYAIPATFKFVLGNALTKNKNNNNNAEEQSHKDRLEEIKSQYSNSEITEAEFEEKLDEYFNENQDMNELALSYN